MNNKPKQVLQVCHSYSPPFADCARQYASLFKETDYQVTTVFLTGKTDPGIAEICASHRVLFLEYDTKELKGLKLNIVKKLRQLIADNNFKLIIAHRTKPTYVALLASNLPVFSIHHAFGDFSRWGRRVFAHFFRKRLTVMGVSHAVRDEIRNKLKSWPKNKIVTLHNRIDVNEVVASQYTRQEARQKLELENDAWIVGNVGRLHPDKKQSTLLEAFAASYHSLPANAQLIIMGRGKLEASLKAQAIELGISQQVKFLGQIENAKRYFAAFDVFVLSSDHEPFGMVLLEALAANIPVICSDCGGGAEVVRGIGDLFPLGDSNSLAQLLIARSQTRSMASSRQYIEDHFSDAAITSQFWSLDCVKQIFTDAPEKEFL